VVLYLLRLAAADSVTNDSARYPKIEVFGSLLELGHKTVSRNQTYVKKLHAETGDFPEQHPLELDPPPVKLRTGYAGQGVK